MEKREYSNGEELGKASVICVTLLGHFTAMEYLEELQDAIRRLHGVESEYVETVPIVEEFEGRTMWEGDVSVFNVIGHPQTDTAYAWIDYQAGKKRYVAVLKLPPVDSPQLAVRAAVVASIRAAQKTAEQAAQQSTEQNQQ